MLKYHKFNFRAISLCFVNFCGSFTGSDGHNGGHCSTTLVEVAAAAMVNTSSSSLYLSSGASMTFRSKKFSDSTSNGYPVTAAIRSQCRRCMALFDIISSSGQHSLKSSIFCFKSMNACQSFRAFGNFLHLHQHPASHH